MATAEHTMKSPESASFRMRAARALTIGAGKETAEAFAAHQPSTSSEGLWGTDTSIRGYAVNGWGGMAEGVVANTVVGSAAFGLDQLEKELVGNRLLKSAKEYIEHKDHRPKGLDSKIKWESPWINVVDNFEESVSDALINAATEKAVNAVMPEGKETKYASAVSEVVSDVVNLGSFIFEKTAPLQSMRITYGKVRNSVNAANVESAFRIINLLPVVGAAVEKYIYTPLNHTLEHNKAVQTLTGWSMKSTVWYVIGMVLNSARADAAQHAHK